MIEKSDSSVRASPVVVSGLQPDQLALSVEKFFEVFPWLPSTQTALSQWDTRRFFEQFLR